MREALIRVYIDAEKLLKLKGILEPAGSFQNHAEQQEHELSVGSSYLLDQLNNEEVKNLNHYMWEKERIVELKLNVQTV